MFKKKLFFFLIMIALGKSYIYCNKESLDRCIIFISIYKDIFMFSVFNFFLFGKEGKKPKALAMSLRVTLQPMGWC